MFVLGVDPGLTRCGYCVVQTNGRDSIPLALGVLTTPKEERVAQRLATIARDIEELLDEFSITAIAIERVLFQVNVSTAMAVGQASGIVMAAGGKRGIDVLEYSPNQVKQSVAGYGNATKDQVGEMVKRLLSLKAAPQPVDASDAAAVALCHVAYSSRHVVQT